MELPMKEVKFTGQTPYPTKTTYKDYVMLQLESLDYSHPWVTDKNHIVDIYNEACKHKGHALDVGTFQGHSALALHLAGLEVYTMDIDEANLKNAPFAKPLHIASEHFTAKPETYQIVMHDAQHGEQIVPELIRYWGYVKSGGVMMVHDTNELNLANLIAKLGYPGNQTTADGRGRFLSMFGKP
jgi:2-polyprenyl-3-methyl-5-hydroxy-6-metoxy-1,4-benzoquinol methylase